MLLFAEPNLNTVMDIANTADNYQLLYELFTTRPYRESKSYTCVKEFTPTYYNIPKVFVLDGAPPQIRTEKLYSSV